MSFPHGPATFDSGSTGASAGAGAFGCDSVAGGGTSTYTATGLFGSAHAVLLHTTGSNRRNTITAVSGDVLWCGFDFQADLPPQSGGASIAGMVECVNAAGVQQFLVYATRAGIIKCRSVGTTVVGDTDRAFFGNPDDENGPTPGEEYHLLVRVNQSQGRATLWIHRPGSFTKIEGLEIGPDPITSIRYGITSNNAFDLVIDNALLTNVDQPIPEQIELASALPGNARPDAFDVMVHAFGYDPVRAKIFTPGAPSSILTTDSFNVTPVDRIAVAATGLQPDTTYEYEIEGLEASAWESISDRATVRTAPQPGRPASDFLGLFGCELNQLGTADHTWVYAKTAGFKAYWHGGDFHYDNNTATSPGPHRDGIADQLARKPDMREFMASCAMLGYNPSDHDGGGGQSAEVQHPSTVYAIEAWMDSIPHADPWHPGECRSTAVTRGRVTYVMPDFRTLARSPSTDLDTDAKLAYSAEDEAIIVSYLDDYSLPVVVLMTDQPWPGQAIDVAPKDDHMANYPNQRARINDRIAARLAAGLGAFIVQADYHGLVWRAPGATIDDTTGGAGLIGIAGSRNDTGNIRAGDLTNYTGYWGEDQSPAANFDIWVSGQLTITDDGSTITLVGECRDNDAGVIRGTVTDSWAIPYAAPRVEQPSYDLGDLQLTDPYGRWSLTRRTEWPTVPGKAVGALNQSVTHGQQLHDPNVLGGDVAIEVLVTDRDTAGVHQGRVELDRNVKTISAACALAFRDRGLPGTTLRFRSQHSAGVTAEAPCYVLSDVPRRDLGEQGALVSFVVSLEAPFSAPTASIHATDLTDGDVGNVRILALDGSVAPVLDAWHRWSGSFHTATVEDWISGQFIRVTVPDGAFPGEADPDVLPADMALVVKGQSCYLVDVADGFDTAEGVRVRGWMVSSSRGSCPLVLHPRPINSDPEDMGVTISLKIGSRSGNPEYQARVRRADYTA